MAQVLIERIDAHESNISVVIEESQGQQKKPNYYMEGIFIQGDVKNHNGRIYPRSEIERAVKNLNEKIRLGHSILGEVDHPSNLQVNLDRVSHIITDIRIDGSNGIGKLKIIDEMPMGRICKTLLESGVKLGVSSRGTGEVDHTGRVKNFDIVTVDIVAQPSAPDAYPRALKEALEHYRHTDFLADIALASIHDPAAERYLKESVLNFIKSLNFNK